MKAATHTRYDVSTTGRLPGEHYYLILRARTSVSQVAAREHRAPVDIYDIRAASMVPPVAPPSDNTMVVIPIGDVTRAVAQQVCTAVSTSGYPEVLFQVLADLGSTNAKADYLPITEEIERLVRETVKSASRPGRKYVGPEVKTKLPANEVAELDRIASVIGIPRSELIRRVLADFMYTGFGVSAQPAGVDAVTDFEGIPWVRGGSGGRTDGSSWVPLDSSVPYEPTRGAGLRWRDLVIQRGGLTPITLEEAYASRPKSE